MTAFLKSDLFLRFLGGFVVGVVGILFLHPGEEHGLTRPAMAASSSFADPAGGGNATL